MRFSLISLLIITSFGTIAQTEIDVINQYIERYIENTEDEVDIQQLASDLVYFYEHPLDLNKTDATDLFAVPFLSGFQALQIIEHRKRFGDFISIYELQVLKSFGIKEISAIRPFVRIRSNFISENTITDIWNHGNHQILTLAEAVSPATRGILTNDTAKNNATNRYLGNAIYSNFRYRFDFKKNISFGLNAEKDAGEPIFNKPSSKGYDYYSYYFALKDIGRIKSFHLGDFQANFGQGLTLSTGLAFGKSSIITNSKRNFSGFAAYRSLRENAFLRGTAISLDIKKWTLGAFASYKKVDGNGLYTVDTLLEGAEDLVGISSIQEDGGFHRTPSEIADKDIIRDFQTGAYLEWRGNSGKVGAVSYLRKLDAPLTLNSQPHNLFNFQGDEYLKNGIYYDFVFRNLNVYGEVSHSSFENKIAQIHGALVSLNSLLDLSLLYRNYENGFINLQTNGYGESSNTSNEKGVYIGFQAKISRNIKILGYYDLYRFPWLRFQTDGPSSGDDFWLEANYRPNKQFRAYYRFRTETKESNLTIGHTKQLAEETISRHRFHMSFKLNKSIELRNRIEWSLYTQRGESSFGSLIYQDLLFKPFGKKAQVTGRIAYSQIESFENRIYSFEQSPLYDYPLFTHGFSGLRFYLMTRYKPAKNTDIWIKYGYTQHDVPLNQQGNTYSIGSGLASTAGNQRHTFTIQLRYIIK